MTVQPSQPTTPNVATSAVKPSGLNASLKPVVETPSKAPFPTTQPQNTPAARPSVAPQNTQATAAGAQVASSSSKTSVGPQAPVSQPSTPTVGTGTTLSGAVKGFEQQNQQGGSSDSGSSGQDQGSQKRRQSAQVQASYVSAASGVQPTRNVEFSGVAQLPAQAATDPAPKRTFASNFKSFVSDLFPSKNGPAAATNDPTTSEPLFPAQWLAGKATPLVPPLAFAAGAPQNIAEAIKPSNNLASYPKRSQFFQTHAAAQALAPERQVMTDWDVQAWGASPGATHSEFDRMPLEVYPIYDEQAV